MEFPGIGDFHGYEERIPVSSSGIIPVYVYAVNVGSGSDTFLGREWIQINEPEKSETLLETDSSIVPEMSVEPHLSINTDISDAESTDNNKDETAQTEELVNSEDESVSVEAEEKSEEVSEKTIKNSEKTDNITRMDNTLLPQ